MSRISNGNLDVSQVRRRPAQREKKGKGKKETGHQDLDLPVYLSVVACWVGWGDSRAGAVDVIGVRVGRGYSRRKRGERKESVFYKQHNTTQTKTNQNETK